MTVDELIQKLKAQGVEATPEQIDQTLGAVEYLTDDDLPSIVEMLAGDAKPAKRKGGNIDKPKAGSIAKLDTNNLPEVSSLSSGEVVEYIAEIERMDAEGQAVSDELVSFLCELYDRRQQAIELAVGAVQRFKAQDAQLNHAMADLNSTLSHSVDSLRDAQQVMQQIGQGGARLGDNFRRGTQRWKSAADRFNSHVAAQSNSSTESAA